MPSVLPSSQISFLIKSGQTKVGKFLILRYQPQKEAGVRWQVIVGGGVDKAHQRNRLKRRLRALLCQSFSQWVWQGGDYLFLIKHQVDTATMRQWQYDLEKLLAGLRS